MALTPKQQLFVNEYIIDFNAARSALAAGYSKKTAGSTGYQNLKKPEVQAAISQAIAKRNERVEIKADYVLNRLIEIDQMDVLDILYEDGALKAISEWPRAWRTTLSGLDLNEMMGQDGNTVAILKKIKWPDKLKNIELLGKHIDVGAFKDKTEVNHTGEVDHNHSYKDISDSELEKRIKELEKKNAANPK